MLKCNVNICNNLFAINNEAQMLRSACIIIIISAESAWLILFYSRLFRNRVITVIATKPRYNVTTTILLDKRHKMKPTRFQVQI